MTQTQRGSTLLIALIMLVLLTLIAISAMSSTTASIQVVGNAQFREEAQAAGQRAIEIVLSNNDFKYAVPPSQNIDVTFDGKADYTVTFTMPSCTSAAEADPTSAVPPLPTDCSGVVHCYWTTWDIAATVTDPSTGASVKIHQGIRTLADPKSATNFCGV